MFPPHDCYVEPFAGSAALFFHKQPSDVEVLNDINGELVNLYRVVQHHLDELVRQFRWALVSRTLFDWAKLTDPRTLTDVQRAARFYYLQRNAFGGKVTSQTFGTSTTVPPRLNLLRMEEDLSAAHLRLARAFIEHLPWADVVRRYDRPTALFFMDPPYWRVAGYGVPFVRGEYDALAEAMRTMKGRALLTINDHPEMRQAFAGFRYESVAITYTVGGNGRSKPTRELIYRSWR
jgi:DNA adenine methylase